MEYCRSTTPSGAFLASSEADPHRRRAQGDSREISRSMSVGGDFNNGKGNLHTRLVLSWQQDKLIPGLMLKIFKVYKEALNGLSRIYRAAVSNPISPSQDDGAGKVSTPYSKAGGPGWGASNCAGPAHWSVCGHIFFDDTPQQILISKKKAWRNKPQILTATWTDCQKYNAQRKKPDTHEYILYGSIDRMFQNRQN